MVYIMAEKQKTIVITVNAFAPNTDTFPLVMKSLSTLFDISLFTNVFVAISLILW